MKRAIILVFILSASSALAAESAINGLYEFGRKGSSGLVEEEDLSDEFYYSKYGVKFGQELSRSSSYYVKYQYYNKIFDTLTNLKNSFYISGFGIDTDLYSKDDLSIKIGPDFEIKEKDYPNTESASYDQIRCGLPLTFKKKDDWVVKIFGGINSYHYPHARTDQLKLNTRIEVTKKLFDEKLDISAFYKYQWVDREKLADRRERTYGTSALLKLGRPLIKNIEMGLEQGMDNTIIYEEREDSYDYKYLNWYIKTSHDFLDIFKYNIKYTDMTRNYADFNHNYDGFMTEFMWNGRIFETKGVKLDLRLTYMHKQFRYPYVSSPFAFHNDNMFSEAELAKKDDWKVTMGSDVKFYNYPAKRTNDKIYYIENVEIDKILAKDLVFGFDYRYTFKNFLHKLDIIEDVFRFRINYKF